MTYAALTKVGNVRAAESDTVWVPTPQRPSGKYGVVFLHGSSAPQQYISAANWASGSIPAMVAMAGIPCVSAEMSGQAFGNDNAMTDIDNAITYLSTKTGVPSTKVHLVGISMGAFTGLRYASLNPSKVASFTGLIPLCDLIYIYENNILGLQSQIGTAWGVTYPTPLPSGADISSSAGAMNGVVPSQFFYAADDTVIVPSSVTTMAATTGGTATNLGNSGGHNEPSIKVAIELDPEGTAANIISFLIENGA